MYKIFIFLGCLSGAFSVLGGAFGAHLLKSTLKPTSLVTFETSVRYHLIHSIALVVLALITRFSTSNTLVWSGILFLIGILFFCGSLYLISLFQFKGIGILTPLGGVALIAAWLLLGISVFTK